MMTMNLYLRRRRKVLFSVFLACFYFLISYLYANNTLYTNRNDRVRLSATTSPTVGSNFDAISNSSSSNNCNDLTFPGRMTADRWQSIGTNGTAFVYSAFQEINIITVIGISLETGLFVCQLWYRKPDGSSMFAVSVKVAVTTIHLKKEMRYRCTMFKCTVPEENKDGDLIGVSLTESPCQQPTNVLPVIHRRYSNGSNSNVRNGYANVRKKYARNEHFNVNKYTLCVSPLHGNYSRAYELIEWIELNKFLGAGKFIFYNSSCTSTLSRVLNSYAQVGIVSVLDWKLPQRITNKKNGVKYFGQLSALNDCLLRNRGHSEFVVNLDLDEFIIPRKNSFLTWDQMLQQLPKSDVYLFLHAFFTPTRIDSRTNYSWYQNASKLHLVTLLRPKRDLRIWDVSERTKYFARTQTTSMLGIHKVLRTSGKVFVVPQSSALLQHYRIAFKNVTQGAFDDTILKKYTDMLIQSVSDKWKSLTDYEATGRFSWSLKHYRLSD